MTLQDQLVAIRGIIASGPEKYQQEIKATAELIRELVASVGDSGKIAAALVAMEYAAAT